MTQLGHRLATTDTYVAPLALGAMLMGTRTSPEESRRILDHFVGTVAPRYRAPDGSQALAMIDTADCYAWWETRGDMGGHSERLLGQWFAETGARDAVYLATKATATLTDLDGVWPTDPAGPPAWEVARTKFVGAAPDVLRASLAGSLERLGTDRVDLYYNHVDDRATPLVDSVGTFASFVADGRVGAYGWSNVTTWRLAEIRAMAQQRVWPQPLALQQQHSYLRGKAGLDSTSIVGPEQLDYLATHPDLQLVAYSPTVKAVYSVPERRVASFWGMEPYAGPDADARFAAVDRVAAATGATGNQVVLAWLRAAQAPTVLPLVGPRTFDHYLEDVEALDLVLTDDQLAELDAAGAGAAQAA